MEHRFNEIKRDATYDEMKEDLRSNCQTEGLPGTQACPESEDAYSKESGESEDDPTANEEVRVTPSENPQKLSQIWLNKHA